MLEKMSEFFDRRVDGYDDHRLNTIESAREFYPYTAEQLPKIPGSNVLDLGCGTGPELERYFALNPEADVTGIDLAEGMLAALGAKLPDRKLTLICGSYFDVPFGEGVFDAAVSVESLHHFTQQEKIPLCAKLARALKPGGYFILTDYFALSDSDEKQFRSELERIRREENIPAGEFCHYDTPLTVQHETEALLAAGFGTVRTLKQWSVTAAIRAEI